MSGGINSADGLTEIESTGTGTVTSVSVATANGFSGSVATQTTTPAITLSMSSEGILAALAALDETAVFGGMATFTAKGAGPGEYTLAKSGIVVKNDNGDEVFRIWGTDPGEDYNTWNFYAGLRSGFSQTTDNDTAGYGNTGVGGESLYDNTLGYYNSGFGIWSLSSNTEGAENSAFGVAALYYNTTGSYNTAVGRGAGFDEEDSVDSRSVVDTEMVFIGNHATRGGVANTTPLTNGIAIGYGAKVLGSNRAVIGNASATDVYFGSESAAANVHAAGYYAGAMPGIDFSGPVTSITVVKGIITAAS